MIAQRATAAVLHCGISIRPMSALGQKQTSRRHWVMSALPPEADINRPGDDVRFVPKADIRWLFDQLISPHGNAECLGGLEVQEQLNFRSLLDRRGLTPAR